MLQFLLLVAIEPKFMVKLFSKELRKSHKIWHELRALIAES